ncbi:MAG: tetratricopeptide repeat protein [Spirochaetes bacterium]|nr:tetratricopeptide repeat protein [Spirochaetota bacterium]
MKISISLLILLIALPCVVAAGGQGGSRSAQKMNGRPDAVESDWSRYSWGLYYKNQALRVHKGPEREAYLKKALACFGEATASGAAPEKIYFQQAECHFYLNDLARSLECAKKSIAVNNRDMRPYNRIYNIHLRQKNFEAAANILEDYLKVRPDSVQVRFILAGHYYKNMSDMDRAAAQYKKVIEISGQQPIEDYYKEQSCFNLAGIAYRIGDMEQAVAMYQAVLDVNRDNLEAIYYLALTHMEMYDLEAAERYSRQYMEKRPGDTVINSVLGRIFYLRDDVRALGYLGSARGTGSMSAILAWGLYSELLRNDGQAEKLLLTVLKFAPKTVSLHLAMARINTRKGDTAAAFNEYVTAGMLMYNSGLFDESKRAFTEASRINDGVAGVYYYLGKAHEDTLHPSLALHYFLKANGLQPDVDLMLHIGYLYGVKKEYDSAIAYFNRATVKEPGNSRPYFFRGLISIWREDYATAERNIQRAISIDDKSETYYFYLAIVMEKRSKLGKAIESLEKAIRNDPRSARSYNYLGYLYADNNIKIDESLILVRKALELEPGNGAYTDSLGWVYYRKGDYRQALEKLLAAEELLNRSKSPDPVVYDHIGDTYLKLGKIEEALKYWNKSSGMKKNIAIEKKIRQYRKKEQ